MTRDQWQRLKRVFHDALDRPQEQRRAWIERTCADDPAVEQEARALLLAHDTADGFLEEPATIEPEDLLDDREQDARPRGEELYPGARIGPYEVLGELGRGGMGVVYLANDQRLDRHVALKALPSSVASSPELRERLRREARAAATISHPAVAVVYALEELDGQLFIISEYVRGHTLRQEIEQGPLEPSRALAIAMQIASALRAAHEAGIIHRDLKPENVLISDEQAVKVVDFGVAHMDGPELRLTRTGVLLGTPAYMAPEQLLGGEVDRRADLFAFGVVLTEMLTGRHPVRQQPDHGEALPPGIADIVGRCLQAAPHARYRSARELLRELEQTLPDASRSTPQARRYVLPRGTSPRWWWEFHQAVAALAYWITVVPAWYVRELIGGAQGRLFFAITLAAVIVSANLRLHLWFTSRFYPGELGWVRARSGRWIHAADWVFVLALAGGGLLAGDGRSPYAIVVMAMGIGAAVAFLVIEPVTTRAAFKSSTGPDS